MKQKKNVTFNDIAKYTGFSKTTISRYFNKFGFPHPGKSGNHLKGTGGFGL